MHTLTKAEFRREAEPILRKVFVNDKQFCQPFAPNVVGRRIVYPCEAYIETPLINAVIAAAANLGDAGCYFSQLSTAPVYPGDDDKLWWRKYLRCRVMQMFNQKTAYIWL